MELINYSSVYLHFVLLFLVQVKVELAHITDLSKPQFCAESLLESKDTIHIEIKMDMTNKTILKNETFSLLTNHYMSEEMIKVCEIPYSSPCSGNSTKECYCQSIQDSIYTFVYKTTARSSHSETVLFVGEELHHAQFLPHVYGKESVNLSVNMEPQFDSRLNQNCTVSAAIESTVVFEFCAYELEYPDLKVSYGGSQEWVESGPCIAVAFCIHSQTKPIEFTYVDKCGRINSTFCIVEVFEETTKRPTQNTTTMIATVSSGYSWIQIVVIVCGLIVLGISFAFIYYQLKESRFLGGSGGSVSKPDAFHTSPVDPSSLLARLSSKLSSSQLHREKQIRDAHEHGTPVDLVPRSH